MTTTNLVVISRFLNALDAEQVRNVLESHGLVAVIEGANVNTMLSYVGTALGGVRVLVRESDEQLARQVIDGIHPQKAGGKQAWYCGRCWETLDASFDLCWKCGGVRAEVEQPLPEDVRNVSYGTSEGLAITGPASQLPKRSTRGVDLDSRQVEFDTEAEEFLLRAWRAAIFGLVTLPVVFHAYSLLLLLRACATSIRFSPQGQRRFWGALGIDVVVAWVFGLIVWSLQ